MPFKDYTGDTVKLVLPVSSISAVRRWLLDNCGRRWAATNYKNQPLDWRQLGQARRNKSSDLFLHLDYTVLVHFKKREDMMLFLLVWPAEVLIKEQNDSIINKGSDK